MATLRANQHKGAMPTFRLPMVLLLSLSGGIDASFAQNAEHGKRLAERWCSECHAFETATKKSHGIPSFEAIAAKEPISAEIIASFLLLPHATMPNRPLSRNDAEDIALFIFQMKK